MSSEDLLVAKLKRWTYDELLDVIVVGPVVDQGVFVALFAKAGWTNKEFAIEHRRRHFAEFPKLRQKKIK